MTCAEWYNTDPTFRAGIDTWVNERQCPFALVDWLYEHDLPAAAEAARWAATEPKRPIEVIWGPASFPYPGSGQNYRWYSICTQTYSRDVPEEQVPGDGLGPNKNTTVAGAMCWLLDNWVI